MIINLWHSWLDMPKLSRQWHINDINDELEELKEASGLINRLSEKSDVVYTYTRLKWTGFNNFKWPLRRLDYVLGTLYMFPKYTLRYLFYLYVGKRLDKSKRVKCVRNPRKPQKIYNGAIENKIDPEKFVAECKKIYRFWIFLP